MPRVYFERGKFKFKDYNNTPLGWAIVIFCICPQSQRREAASAPAKRQTRPLPATACTCRRLLPPVLPGVRQVRAGDAPSGSRGIRLPLLL